MGMRQEREAKIESGVLACLDECRAKDQPFTRLSAFIDKLQENPNWPDKDIIELQTRVIRVLLYRHGRPGSESDQTDDVRSSRPWPVSRGSSATA